MRFRLDKSFHSLRWQAIGKPAGGGGSKYEEQELRVNPRETGGANSKGIGGTFLDRAVTPEIFLGGERLERRAYFYIRARPRR